MQIQSPCPFGDRRGQIPLELRIHGRLPALHAQCSVGRAVLRKLNALSDWSRFGPARASQNRVKVAGSTLVTGEILRGLLRTFPASSRRPKSPSPVLTLTGCGKAKG